MQGNLGNIPVKQSRKRAVTSKYVSPNQIVLEGFETPFAQKLSKQNRWVKLNELIPWDSVVRIYDKNFSSKEGRPPINGRVVIGAVIIKHMLDLTDRETIMQIQENVFMQYFIGLSSFTNEEPFSHTLFVSIRERLGLEVMTEVNDIILQHHKLMKEDHKIHEEKALDNHDKKDEDIENKDLPKEEPNQGKLLVDATVAPQNITFPTDLKLLNSSRVKTEKLIDKLYNKHIHKEKPRTYREVARKEFLNTAKKKQKTYKEIYKTNGSQLRFLGRNINHVLEMLDEYKSLGELISIPLKKKDYEYLDIVQQVYNQQNYMYQNNIHTVENRIVSIHQSHVRPIVRGKEGRKVEFGSKLNVSMVKGFSSIDKMSWDNFNEGTCLKETIEKYKTKFGYYPKEVLADQIYCNRENRQYLKEKNIILKGKQLGRPKKDQASSNLVSPGERNPIEGKFGQAKVGYGMNLIRAKLKNTSESWVASIILVLNLVNLTRRALLCYIDRLLFLFFGKSKVVFSL